MHPKEKSEKILQVVVEKMQTPTKGEPVESTQDKSETTPSVPAEPTMGESETAPLTAVEPSDTLTMDVSMESQEEQIQGL